MVLIDLFYHVLCALKCMSFSVFSLQTEHLAQQTQFKERETGSVQCPNGLNSRRFDCEDENPVGEDRTQQMYPLYDQMRYQDGSPGRHHPYSDLEGVYINPREHYV